MTKYQSLHLKNRFLVQGSFIYNIAGLAFILLFLGAFLLAVLPKIGISILLISLIPWYFYFMGEGLVSIENNILSVQKGGINEEFKIQNIEIGWSYIFFASTTKRVGSAGSLFPLGGKQRARQNTIVMNILITLENEEKVVIQETLFPWQSTPHWKYLGDHLHHIPLIYRINGGVKKFKKQMDAITKR